MKDRGYPVADDEEAMADLSVDHAPTVDRFCAAQRITANAAAGNADTEDLRQALIHYRALFSDLLGDEDDASDGQAPPSFTRSSRDSVVAGRPRRRAAGRI
jgi:hypothetical protein